MTAEEFKEFAGSEDGKSIIAEYISESGYKSVEEISGLENKKNELLGKLKKANEHKALIDELYRKYDIIDSDDLASKLQSLSAAKSKESDLEKLQRRLEIIEKGAAEDKKRADSERALRVASEKKTQIVTALKNAHVDDDVLDTLIPYFDGMAKAEELDDGKINFVIGDDEPSSLNSFVEQWSKTDKAKQFIKAPSNRGGGSGGPGDATKAGQMTLEQIAAIPDRAQRMKAYADQGIRIE